MADYHILNGGSDGNSYTIVFHIPIPDQNNDVGVNLRTALSEQLGGSVQSAVPGNRLGSGEQTALDAGELYEHVWKYSTHPGMTLLQQQAELDAKFGTFSTSVVNEISQRLSYWGYERDVP